MAEKLVLFNIPESQATIGLQRFGQQSKQTIVFSHALTKNKRTNALNGYFTEQQGLYILLRNTGLVANTDTNDAVTIALDDQKIKKQQNPTRQIANKQLASKHIESVSVEKISVFGQPYNARSALEFPVPIDIIANEQLLNTGQSELGRMLQMLAPSFNYASSAISDGTDVLKPATLRGLGPDQTLVLINGKRRHQASLVHINTSVGRGTAGVDFNAIPINAIEKIEILRDGAAARFGSDAIAGVINIVLKSGSSLDQLTLDYGEFSQGDGENSSLYGNLGFSIFDHGFFNLSLTYKTQEKTDRSGLQANCQYENCDRLSNGHWLSKSLREFTAKRNSFQIGNPEYNQLIVSYHSEIPVDNYQLYSFALYSKRKNESAAFYRSYNNDESNPVLSDGERLSKEGYLPFIQSDIIDLSYSIGLKNQLTPNTKLDLSYSFGRNVIDYNTSNSYNPSYATYLDNRLNVSANKIRSEMPSSIKAYDLSLSLQTLNFDVAHIASWANFTTGMELRRDSYNINSGEEYSYFDYTSLIKDYQGQALGGVQGFPGISPEQQVDQDRKVLSFYADLSTDVSPALQLSSAIRFDNYSDFGKTSNVKLAALWQLNDTANFRGSISTGFRAPSMPQLYFNNISSQFIVDTKGELIAEHVGTFRNDSELAKNIGIKPLTEEKSLNFSLGATFSAGDNLTFTLDLYRIEIDDRIVISNKLCADDSLALAQALSAEKIEKAQFFLNGADTVTQGIDLITQWKKRFDNSNLSVTFAANYTDTKVRHLMAPQSEALAPLSIDQIFSKQDISIIEEWQPESRISITTEYHIGDWTLNLALNQFGQYTITDGKEQTFSPELLTDFKIEYHFNSKWSAYLGSNNLFNVNPDRNKIGNSHGGTIVNNKGEVIVSSPGVFKYSRRSAPFGFNGRYAYMGMRFVF